MSDDLDLRGIDSRHEPNPEFRAALHRRVAAIVDGIDPDVVTGDRDMVAMDLESTSANSAPSRNRRLVAQVILAAAAIRGDRARGEPRRGLDASRPTGADRDRAPDDASTSAARPPLRIPNCSHPGLTSSMTSTEHRRRGSSSPSAPGGRTSSTRASARTGPLQTPTVLPTTSASSRSADPTRCTWTPATRAMGSTRGL